MMMGFSMNPHLYTRQSLEQELRQNIDPMVARHWDKKIRAGIIPTEILQQQGQADKDRHKQETERLAEFKVKAALPIIQSLAIRLSKTENPLYKQLHYFGIGSAGALEAVTRAANDHSIDVVAYDICQTGCKNGRKVFRKLEQERLITSPFPCTNRVRQADIEYACDERFITPGSSRLVFAARVLDVLDSPLDGRPHPTRQPSLLELFDTKMARTARKLGKLLKFLKVFLVHPEPQNNPDAIWGDSTPCSLEIISEFMAQGLEAPAKLTKVATTRYYNHVYTAALFER